LQGGTLLLDEVSSLSLECQAKLLRVLESRTYRPLGSLNIRTADVRFIASSSEDLGARVARGQLRADLYYRLRGVEIQVPPLSARKEDLPLLARHLLAVHARRLKLAPPVLSAEAQAALEAHDWPGNVRELETVLFRSLLSASPGGPIPAQLLRSLLPPPRASALFQEDLVAGRDLEELKRQLERVYLTRLFKDLGGDLGKMLEILGIKLPTLYRRLQRAGIDIHALRRELGSAGR
ncbi:MAG: sigma 54-interacting transcriptional regulator, partial [Thermoanaerobaculia bacterium]